MEGGRGLCTSRKFLFSSNRQDRPVMFPLQEQHCHTTIPGDPKLWGLNKMGKHMKPQCQWDGTGTGKEKNTFFKAVSLLKRLLRIFKSFLEEKKLFESFLLYGFATLIRENKIQIVLG